MLLIAALALNVGCEGAWPPACCAIHLCTNKHHRHDGARGHFVDLRLHPDSGTD
jgi:hypothetical protein